ncbi:dapper homolog 2 [Tachyglossus aculeatus]|uniref:dapper homolog 2 n=1 Tax=Tachyglossus aculeatus TaxID=9261 RepID=UPI0018F2A4DA|nr:dapper homolog 2 [Tachyglossus aculeatus]
MIPALKEFSVQWNKKIVCVSDLSLVFVLEEDQERIQMIFTPEIFQWPVLERAGRPGGHHRAVEGAGMGARSGWERWRGGERLQAALAGLQELVQLRARQQQLVSAALALGPGGPPPRPPAPEARLEASLAALKEQLSHLRRQDIGLKSHLDQLDQQINELKLDVSQTSSEYLDSDSRPSSGFYDLSDGGSASLSTSCASVSSESISSWSGGPRPGGQPPSAARLGLLDYRPKSADGITVQAVPLQQRGVYVPEGGWGRAGLDPRREAGGRPKPRPVSTGDLGRTGPLSTELQKASSPELRPSSLLVPGADVQFLPVDPKYRSDLVSRNGSDVYLYPSPLHAVALQSPLFSLAGGLSPLRPPTSEAAAPRLLGVRPGVEEGYIDKLLRLNQCQGNCTRGAGPRGSIQGPLSTPTSKGAGLRTGSGPKLQKQVLCSPERSGAGERGQGEAQSHANLEQPTILPVTESVATKHCPAGKLAASNSSLAAPVGAGATLARREVGRGRPGRCLEGLVSDQLLQRRESLSLRPAPVLPEVKTLKIKRRNSEKVQRLLPGRMPGTSWAGLGLRLEDDPSPRAHGGRGLVRRPTFSGEGPTRFCSESSLYRRPVGPSPALLSPPKLDRAPTHSSFRPTTAASSTGIPRGPIKKKQRRWQSSMEISARTPSANFLGSRGLLPARRRAGALRLAGLRVRSGCPHRSPPAGSQSDQSEYSAECASLFHSTLTETSEEEDTSDCTANRFGDSESSDGEMAHFSRSSLALQARGTGGESAWPRSRMPAQVPAPPGPRVCRIKASKALKKKIRRFQPAALKVMTTV